MTMESQTSLQPLNRTLQLENEDKLLDLMPLELWRMVDDRLDAKRHTLLRASCSFFRTWLPLEKDVEFTEYKRLSEGIFHSESDSFQAAVHLNPRTLKQEHYNYLCKQHIPLEVFRICRFSLQDPFTCAHIDLGVEKGFAIRQASWYGRSSLVELLLQDQRVDPAARDNVAIKFASQNGHLAVVELLLQDPRVDPSDVDNDAIRFASSNGHLAVVQLLLRDPRVDPSAKDNWAIRFASSNGHLAVVRLLLLQDPRVSNAYCAKPYFKLPKGIRVPRLPTPEREISSGPAGDKFDRRRRANMMLR